MISLNHMTKIEVDPIEAGNFVAQVLQDDFDFISKEINEYNRKKNLSAIETEDMLNSVEVRSAMNTLLKYYMTYKDYKEFMELQRVYGNVV